ncbi:hypothetical protein P152DRAFT_157483 [Eremomyces bilateralis CBS 781.70]|uniref:Uncharacterized protein n=1 Tax=Eremomyces bilateralis CBS 781.70 TaxID=1392243 RepID=A0A6G1FU77_9PEZI|nr:uncharacterized protein P152DRAFT_157483 [Eremomyces bilateralis CBS 781.70]KAF1809445.1 hypothetical protein P152DRAFT_157483 [Eremomyces bilateralis CBS 781.70]
MADPRFYSQSPHPPMIIHDAANARPRQYHCHNVRKLGICQSCLVILLQPDLSQSIYRRVPYIRCDARLHWHRSGRNRRDPLDNHIFDTAVRPERFFHSQGGCSSRGNRPVVEPGRFDVDSAVVGLFRGVRSRFLHFSRAILARAFYYTTTELYVMYDPRKPSKCDSRGRTRVELDINKWRSE